MFIKIFFAKIFIILRFSSLFLLSEFFFESIFIFFCNKFLKLFSKFFSSTFFFFFLLFDFFVLTLIKLSTLNLLISCNTPVTDSFFSIFFSELYDFNLYKLIVLSKEDIKVIISRKNI